MQKFPASPVSSPLPDANGRLPLHTILILPIVYDEAQKAHNAGIAVTLMERTPNSLAHQDHDGNTPLHFMATHGYSLLLERAITLKQDAAFTENNNGEYPIHTAISSQQYDAAILLLNLPGMLDVRDSQGKSLLHHATIANNLSIVAHLTQIMLPGDISQADSDGQTPLDIAKAGHFTTIVDCLERAGALPSRTPSP